MEAVDRFYRNYSKYLNEYSNDSLYNLLNSLHSLNDKLKSDYQIDLFKMDEFITLKTIRNYLHHKGELVSKLTIVPITEEMSIRTDLAVMCLMTKKELDLTIIEIKNLSHRKEQQEKIYNTVHLYGDVVNIAHVIFNMAAKLMEFLSGHNIKGKSKEYDENYECYLFDTNNGYSITIDGKLYGGISFSGDIGNILMSLLKESHS